MLVDRRKFLNFATAGTVTTAIPPFQTIQNKKKWPPNNSTIFDFQQVDVFSSEPLRGNPLAVVIGADSLSDEQMAAFASWTNLSETNFLLKPKSPNADYRVRIFTRQREVPFAGHPTLGSCHVWLAEGGVANGTEIVQECGLGLIHIRRAPERLSFVAPKLVRSGPVEPEILAESSGAWIWRLSRKTLTISDDLLNVLKTWRQETQFSAPEHWVFASPVQLGKLPYSYSGVKQELQRAASVARLGHLRSHAFRHTYRTWLDSVGTPVGVQQRLMRHADIRTTMNIYGDAVTPDMREAHGKIVGLALNGTEAARKRV